MLTLTQLAVIESPANSRLFLHGPAGCGKTTTAVERMRALLNSGIPGDQILMLTPQRTLQEPYLEMLNSAERSAGGEVTPATVGGIARRMVDLFWPLCAEPAGFAYPHLAPTFLTLETAQYFMAHLVRPLLDQGYFESVTIERNRLYSQILDNLNKAASIGFPHTEIGQRLDAAYYGEPAQRRVYLDAQDCANRFRQFCLENNLLDFSLQLEIFWNHLWPDPLVREYLSSNYRHLIYDNMEEDIPRAHDLLREWMPVFESALLIYDEEGGYRKFLGADTTTAWALNELCDEAIELNTPFVSSPEISSLGRCLSHSILFANSDTEENSDLSACLSILQTRFYPELLDDVANECATLLNQGLPASEVVILTPYLSDALRFSLMNRLEKLGIPVRSHRPSRSLREEPASRCLLTLASLAHPHWNIIPPKFDITYALMQVIEGLDLVRAQLLTEIVYHPRDLSLSSFEGIKPEVQERITYSAGERYTRLGDWLAEYRQSEALPLDHFLRRLFGEILSQPGFGFHTNFDAARVASSLIESVRKFRQALEPSNNSPTPGLDAGKEYLDMLADGVIAAQYLDSWQDQGKDALLVAPAHTFLMTNRPVSVQFWLDAGSNGWYERLSQPLTQPYVLSRGWEPGRVWADADEVTANREAMAHLAGGLLRRCRDRLYLCLTDLGESGFEQRGEMVRAFQQVLTGREP